MTSFRLIPIVLVATTALLLLKTVGLVTQGGYTLVGTGQAQAQAVPSPASEGGDEVKLSPIEEAAAQRAADSLFAQEPAPEPSDGLRDAIPVRKNQDGEEVPLATAEGGSLTEQAVLERLSERRAQLDERERAIEMQAGLVAAAEIQLNEKIASLEALEARVQALLDQQSAQGDAQFDALVSMYSNMKPADAANVFNTLNMEILLRLAIRMSPRKMSPILASMNTQRAQELTIRMATASEPPDPADLLASLPGQGQDELPQIVGQ